MDQMLKESATGPQRKQVLMRGLGDSARVRGGPEAACLHRSDTVWLVPQRQLTGSGCRRCVQEAQGST